MAPGDELRVSVKHGPDVLEIVLPASGAVGDLMEQLQARTNVLPRGQKLIFKGKVLTPEMSLSEAKLVNGSKLMMLATQGAHQGAAPILKDPVASLKAVLTLSKPVVQEKLLQLSAKSRLEAWRSTGIISLADCRIKEVPPEIWEIGPAARVLDVSWTMMEQFPSEVSKLSNLQRLSLKGNCFMMGEISWTGIYTLKHLQVLVLEDNRFTYLPLGIRALSSLKQLLLANNQLVFARDELGELPALEKLDLSNNRLEDIPPGLGNCSTLVELDVSKNLITEVPPSLGNLRKLKVLNLDNNALKDFPAEVLKGCVELISLSLHNNEITMEALREVDGWKEYDARRRSKHDKQIDFHVLGSSDGFDEGADSKRKRHW